MLNFLTQHEWETRRTEILTQERKGRLVLFLYQIPGAQLDLFYLQRSEKLGTPLPQVSARVLASQCSRKHLRAECGRSSSLPFSSLLVAKPLDFSQNEPSTQP